MVLLLVLLFIVVPIAEIYVIIQVGQAIGALWTILLLIVDSIIGAWLLSWQGRRAWLQLPEALAAGQDAAPRDPRRRPGHLRRRVPAHAGLHHGHLRPDAAAAADPRGPAPRCSSRASLRRAAAPLARAAVRHASPGTPPPPPRSCLNDCHDPTHRRRRIPSLALLLRLPFPASTLRPRPARPSPPPCTRGREQKGQGARAGESRRRRGLRGHRRARLLRPRARPLRSCLAHTRAERGPVTVERRAVGPATWSPTPSRNQGRRSRTGAPRASMVSR